MISRSSALATVVAAAHLCFDSTEAWSVVVRMPRSMQSYRTVDHGAAAAAAAAASWTTTTRLYGKLPWELDDDDDMNSNLKSRVSTRSELDGCRSMQASTLAKLAAAFSPPDRRINLKDISSVEVINVSGDQIEIQATVCDDTEYCVALFVPVSFPNSCLHLFKDEEELCVLDNLKLLHNDAEGRITTLDRNVASDSLEMSRPDLALDQSRPTSKDYRAPTWWIKAEEAFNDLGSMPSLKTMDLVEECTTIKALLNCGDFDDEIVALARDGLLLGVEDGFLYEIEKAVVADVGPTGFYLRARAVDKEKGMETRSTLELYWPFDGEPALDPTTLRSKVLGAVAAVSGEI